MTNKECFPEEIRYTVCVICVFYRICRNALNACLL